MLSRLERVKAFRDKVNANIIATRKLIRVDELSPEELESIVNLYVGHQTNFDYKVGDLIRYEGKLYLVLQAHTSLENWLPNELPALYKNLLPDNIIPEWKVPTGAHDAYKIGDKVIFKSKVYESLLDGNTYSPEEYPTGWRLI